MEASALPSSLLGVCKKIENPFLFVDIFALFLLLSFLCLFCACLLLFLCLGPSGTLKPQFLSIQMLPPLLPKGAPRLPKGAPRASQRRLVWLLCGTSGGFAGQKSQEKPMNFENLTLFLLLSFLGLFSACLLLFLCLGPSGTLKHLFLSIQMLRHLPPEGAPRASQERSRSVPRATLSSSSSLFSSWRVQKCL